MGERIQAVKGMNDILPDETYKWRYLEKTISQCLNQYGYSEIRLPIIESTQLYKRTIGEITDIVEKEMYTFTDINGDSLTLRPEGTAGCVRACLEHGLLYNQQPKLWYQGPMFRHERPQKGRYRQFNQLGVEVFGISDVEVEIELIAMCQTLWKRLGVDQHVSLQINTLGSTEERTRYREVLVDYFKQHFTLLDEDSKRRLERNPLRILDSKNPQMKDLIEQAPKLLDVLEESSKQRFLKLCEGLDRLSINYTINPFLVRGLDYYGHIVFEWVTDKLGAQATFCAGGRYDALVEQLGGKPTPAVGFAIGMERLFILSESVSFSGLDEPAPYIYIVAMGEKAVSEALSLSETLRSAHFEWSVLVNLSGGSFKSQFKKADKSGAKLAIIIGDDEVNQQVVGIKDLRSTGTQENVSMDQIIPYIEGLGCNR